jgi:hypothetical protein
MPSLPLYCRRLVSLSCSSSSQSLGRLLALGGSHSRPAAVFGCLFGAFVRRASFGGRRVWICLRGPGAVGLAKFLVICWYRVWARAHVWMRRVLHR